jgi:exodeoxyribonuclease III (xth)
MSGDQIPLDLKLSDYHVSSNSADRNGYSGTMILSRSVPLSTMKGMGTFYSDNEGRVITSEFDDFFVVSAYFPNARRDLSRLDMKGEFFMGIENFLNDLEKKKPVVICGDFNVARDEIDIARPKDNVNSPGFTQSERNMMSHFLRDHFVGYFSVHESR